MMRALLTVAALAVVAGNINIDVEFECLSSNDQGGCMKWKQTGKIENSAACFPASALVQTPNGHKRMDDLAVGDQVLAMSQDGRVEFSPVRAWLHRDPTSPVTYLALKTAAGTLRATPTHNVYVDSAQGGNYILAEQVKVGDVLRMPNGVAKVESISKMAEMGAFAPLTYESTLFVGDVTDALLLAHSYAGVRSPSSWQVSLFNALLSAAEMTIRDVHTIEDPSAPYLHPVAKAIAPLIGISVDAKVVKEFEDGQMLPLASEEPRDESWGSWARRRLRRRSHDEGDIVDTNSLMLAVTALAPFMFK